MQNPNPKIFLSTLSLRRATHKPAELIINIGYFYPRSPCGERHIFFHKKDRQSSISIHALLAESDHRAIDIQSPTTKFLSTLSLRRATGTVAEVGCMYYISIHALLAESDRREGPRCQGLSEFLSTLSLRRATLYFINQEKNPSISIHALLAESDPGQNLINGIRLVFLSTLSLRRATNGIEVCTYSPPYFYPRSPCGERPWHLHCVFIFAGISIHALLAESDEQTQTFEIASLRISIHALLAESDTRTQSASLSL